MQLEDFMNAVSTISTKYQVTIPRSVRKFFDFVKPNTKVLVSYEDNKIIIQEQPSLENLIGILETKPEIFKKTSKMSAEKLKKEAAKMKIVEYKRKYGKVN